MDSKCYNGNTGSSSRKGKKNNNSKTIKEPQRGLGVAQLEKLRLQNHMMANYIHHYPSFQSPFQTSSEIEFTDSSRTNEYICGSASMRSSVHVESGGSLPYNFMEKGSLKTPSTNYHYFFDSNDSQDVDLELRLAL